MNYYVVLRPVCSVLAWMEGDSSDFATTNQQTSLWKSVESAAQSAFLQQQQSVELDKNLDEK